MRIWDAMYLGWANLRSHLGRSLLVLGVISVLFCLIFVAQLGFQGLENQYIAAAGQKSSGKVVIFANAVMDNGEEYVKVDPEMIKQDIEANRGMILGDVQDYMVGGYFALPESLIGEAIEVSLLQVSTGKMPILLNANEALGLAEKGCPQYFKNAESKREFYLDLRENVLGRSFEKNGMEYVAVGLAPGGMCTSNLSFSGLDRSNNSILNPLLEYLAVDGGASIGVQDQQSEPYDDSSELSGIIAVFNNPDEVYEYMRHGHGGFMGIELPGQDVQYNVSVIAGMSPEMVYLFRVMHLVINIGCAVLAIVGVIVVIFTSIRLVDQNRQIMQLYRVLGATTGQIKLVYACYFLELMIGAVIGAFVLASVITVLYSVINQTNLEILFMTGFNLSEAPRVVLWGMNWWVVGFGFIMLMTVPLCLFVNRGNFRHR